MSDGHAVNPLHIVPVEQALWLAVTYAWRRGGRENKRVKPIEYFAQSLFGGRNQLHPSFVGAACS
jgi:hypothetical protein